MMGTKRTLGMLFLLLFSFPSTQSLVESKQYPEQYCRLVENKWWQISQDDAVSIKCWPLNQVSFLPDFDEFDLDLGYLPYNEVTHQHPWLATCISIVFLVVFIICAIWLGNIIESFTIQKYTQRDWTG
mmetsp:Transcript_5113/g.7069  ORF Transcript_5113/g.7069 Transcript_5113/m.7069 type:complete len:128 (-) Transcript_5113:183-566(-)